MRSALVLFVAFGVATAAHAQQRPSQFMAKYGWLNNLDQAKAEARKTGKPIFLVFRCEP
jgi:hypothetical protein